MPLLLSMAELIAWVEEQRAAAHLHPLLIIAIAVIVFLEIHPFEGGNGRLSRALTTLLLLQNRLAYARRTRRLPACGARSRFGLRGKPCATGHPLPPRRR